MSTESDSSQDLTQLATGTQPLPRLPGDTIEIGAVLNDRYLVTQRLGKGGFGEVFLAEDRRLLSKRVVIKVLLAASNGSGWSRKKFRSEMEALARIDHPGVVTLLDEGETSNGFPFLVMQYVEGRTLRSIVGNQGADLQRAANIIRQIGHALTAAHDKGVYHRDLKPENVMLQPNLDGSDSVKLIDFGIATVRDSQLLTNHDSTVVAGSNGYMAPEQLLGKPVLATDIYAFGVIAYELVTGRVPFSSTSGAQMFELQQRGVRVKPKDLRNELPGKAQTLILRALSFRPEDRPERASTFGDDLASVMGLEESPLDDVGTGLPELAHVLLMDLVAHSTLPIEEQREHVDQLQEIVRKTLQFRAAERDRDLIRLPTGDGMALAFFGDPTAPLECALEIAVALASGPDLKLRMGLNTGLVYRMADINANLNVNGGGINLAQRIMDAGDAGHILLSQSTADVLLQLKQWAPSVYDLGEHTDKNNVKLRFYNFHSGNLGNPAIPARFREERARFVRSRKRRWLAVATLVAAVLVGVEANHLLSPHLNRRRSVAVLGFRNITSRSDAEWVSMDLAEGLRTELASTGKVRTISGEEVAEMKKNLGLSGFESMGKNTLSRLHNLGADLVVVGSYTDRGKEAGGQIHLNLEIQDASAGETIDSIVADGTEAEISQLVSQTGTRLRAKLRLGQLSPEKERQVAVSQPSEEAAPFYFEGLTALRRYEPMQARGLLEKTIAIDANFPFAHAALAEAWSILGYDQKGREESKKAFDLSTNLSLEDRLSVEGRYRGLAADWQAAIASYDQLYKHFPDNLDYGLRLAEAQRSAGKGKDALTTLAELRKLPKPQGSDPRIDLEEAETAASLRDFRRAQTASASAAEKAKGNGARLLEARSLIWSCSALRNLGQLNQAKHACDEARKIDSVLEDRLGTARAVTGLAIILKRQGDLNGAMRMYEQALSIAEGIGAKRDMSGALNNIANLLADQGQLARAKERYEEALKIQREIGFKTQIVLTLRNLGTILDQEGNLDEAQGFYQQSIVAARENGSQGNLALGLENLANLLFERGNMPGAEQHFNDAIAIEKDIGDKANLASTLDSLADLLLARGDLTGAEQKYREAMSIQEQLGGKGKSATSRAGLAAILLERGQSSQAETAIRQPLAEFRSEKDPENEISARVLLIRALLAQKKLTEAQTEMSVAERLVGNTLERSLRYKIAITAAHMSVALGGRSNQTGAINTLENVATEAKKAGMLALELEARLAIGETEQAQGKVALANAHLNAVRREAVEKGFTLIAKKAAK